jgi:hypothetical protein
MTARRNGMKLNAVRKLDALYEAGVDNWDGFGDAVEHLSEEELEDPVIVFDALMVAGVDNWEGYDHAMKVARNGN